MDAARLEHAERLTPIRLGLFGTGAVLALIGAGVWIAQVRAERKLQWREQIAWETYRREDAGRAMVRQKIQENAIHPMQGEHAIANLGLDKPREQPPPPNPREVSLKPPLGAVAALLAALAAVVGGDSVRRTQVAEIQAVADAAARARREQAEQHDAQEPAPRTPVATAQPVMPDDAEPHA